jgi:hypothetical protein
MSFVTLVLCLVAAFLMVVHAPLDAWMVWIAAVGFCAMMIWTHNRPGGSSQR